MKPWAWDPVYRYIAPQSPPTWSASNSSIMVLSAVPAYKSLNASCPPDGSAYSEAAAEAQEGPAAGSTLVREEPTLRRPSAPLTMQTALQGRRKGGEEGHLEALIRSPHDADGTAGNEEISERKWCRASLRQPEASVSCKPEAFKAALSFHRSALTPGVRPTQERSYRAALRSAALTQWRAMLGSPQPALTRQAQPKGCRST